MNYGLLALLFLSVLSPSAIATEDVNFVKSDNGRIQVFSVKDEMTEKIVKHTIEVSEGFPNYEKLYFVCTVSDSYYFGSNTQEFNGFQISGSLLIKIDKKDVRNFTGTLGYKEGFVSTQSESSFYALLGEVSSAKNIKSRITTPDKIYNHSYSPEGIKPMIQSFINRCKG